jgi:plastocyanin
MSRLRTLPALFAVFVVLVAGACGESETGQTTATNDTTTTEATTATTDAGGPATTTAGGTATTTAAGAGGGKTVSLKNLKFVPDEITIKKGDSVTFKWDEKVLHNVTSKEGSDLKSGNKDSGTYRKTFPKAGEYEYECTLHSGMEGKVEVE